MEQFTLSQSSNVHDAVAPDRGLMVRHFRQIVLWPLQLMPIQKHGDFIQAQGFDNLWQEVEDEFTGDPSLFQE